MSENGTRRRKVGSPADGIRPDDDALRVVSLDGEHWAPFVGVAAQALIRTALDEAYAGRFGELWVRVIVPGPSGGWEDWESIDGRPCGMTGDELLFPDGVRVPWGDVVSFEM